VSTRTTQLVATQFVFGTPTPAVPELETYALLLASLGLMGVIARRRRAVRRVFRARLQKPPFGAVFLWALFVHPGINPHFPPVHPVNIAVPIIFRSG
jgi:hypothetical protein